jgi:uncharacterized cupredoxin-like copper-binding protein
VNRRTTTIVVIAAVVALASLSVVALAAIDGGFGRRGRWHTACAVPALPGTVVGATLTNMGGPMMGGPMMGGMMRLSLDHATVTAGQVSFVAYNAGSVAHELVILPLPGEQIVGTRPIGGDAKVDETGSLGEASASCATGSGEGIAPGASGWVTVTLAKGRYEIVCNQPGHYTAGMYAQLTVD